MDLSVSAVVTDIADPEKRGRIRVASSDLLGDEETTMPEWIEPLLQWWWFTLPEVGDEIEVVYADSGETDEIRGQTSIIAPDMRWLGWRRQDDIDPIFKTNYGKRRGFKTDLGVLYFDDSAQGEVVISCGTPGSTIKIKADGTVDISGTKVVVTTSTPASILLGGIGANQPLALAFAVLANLQALNTMIQGLPPGDAPVFAAALKLGFVNWIAAVQSMADTKTRGGG